MTKKRLTAFHDDPLPPEASEIGFAGVEQPTGAAPARPLGLGEVTSPAMRSAGADP